MFIWLGWGCKRIHRRGRGGGRERRGRFKLTFVTWSGCGVCLLWEIRTGCGNVNMVEGDAGRAACVLFCKEMSAYDV